MGNTSDSESNYSSLLESLIANLGILHSLWHRLEQKTPKKNSQGRNQSWIDRFDSLLSSLISNEEKLKQFLLEIEVAGEEFYELPSGQRYTKMLNMVKTIFSEGDISVPDYSILKKKRRIQKKGPSQEQQNEIEDGIQTRIEPGQNLEIEILLEENEKLRSVVEEQRKAHEEEIRQLKLMYEKEIGILKASPQKS